jgi:hypothetical protein
MLERAGASRRIHRPRNPPERKPLTRPTRLKRRRSRLTSPVRRRGGPSVILVTNGYARAITAAAAPGGGGRESVAAASTPGADAHAGTGRHGPLHSRAAQSAGAKTPDPPDTAQAPTITADVSGPETRRADRRPRHERYAGSHWSRVAADDRMSEGPRDWFRRQERADQRADRDDSEASPEDGRNAYNAEEEGRYGTRHDRPPYRDGPTAAMTRRAPPVDREPPMDREASMDHPGFGFRGPNIFGWLSEFVPHDRPPIPSGRTIRRGGDFDAQAPLAYGRGVGADRSAPAEPSDD